jgi:hypothetical protein
VDGLLVQRLTCSSETFAIPETSTSLFNLILAILFRHRAFYSPEIASPQDLDSIEIKPGEPVWLSLRKELDDVPFLLAGDVELVGDDSTGLGELWDVSCAKRR